MLVKSWLKMYFFTLIYIHLYIYIYIILWFHSSSSKRFSQARVQFDFMLSWVYSRSSSSAQCLLLLFLSFFFFFLNQRPGLIRISEGRQNFLWPLPLSQDEATPRAEAPVRLLCGVLIDSFPAVHGGSPWALPGAVLVLYLMKGRLPVHTDCWGGGDRGTGGAEGGGGEIEKMDVETETRSGGRLQGQLYHVDGNKMENSVSTFFMRLLANFSRQHAPAQRTSHEDINVCIPVAAAEGHSF